MTIFPINSRWGNPPWTIDFCPTRNAIPQEVDFAVVGGGFTGLSAAAWLRRLEPNKSVAIFEAGAIGAGASGHTGGLVLAETAAGDLPGLGDVLAGFTSGLVQLEVDGDLTLPGAWEIGRTAGLSDSSISWSDSGTLRTVKNVPGGTIDPGKLVSGFGRAAEHSGALIFENSPVEDIAFESPIQLRVAGEMVRAQQALLVTNAMSLELSNLSGRAEPKFTLAIATEPMSSAQIAELGLASGRPFYTVDFPYLWGRLLRTGAIVFGCGLVHMADWRELADIDVASGESAVLISRLEDRVRGLHPAMERVRFAHRWGGPILIASGWRPVFSRHPRSSHAIVLGGFSGHGVALSSYLGRWAAEALCGRRELPQWDSTTRG